MSQATLHAIVYAVLGLFAFLMILFSAAFIKIFIEITRDTIRELFGLRPHDDFYDDDDDFHR